MVGFDELKLGRVDELSLAHPDPVVLELNRLQNQLKGFSLLHSSCFMNILFLSWVPTSMHVLTQPMTIIFLFYIIPEKDRELGNAQGEIKSLRAAEVLKDKAIEEVLRISMQAI